MTKKAKLFRFAGYKIYAKSRKIVFTYSMEFYGSKTLNFFETIILPKKTEKLNHKDISKFLEPLSLILGISYYKLYCPPKIETFCKLSRKQAEFWNIVYKKGLGEFLFRNKLDPKKIAKFPFAKVKVSPVQINVDDSILLGIGGGKDSIVALKLLEKLKLSLLSIETMRPEPVSGGVIKKSGKPSVKIQRIFDSQILNLTDTYRGHIPISAIYAFLGILSCALYGHRYFVVANEYGSNFGNIKYKGQVVNHQWSKSAEFESLFQEYTKKFITPDITYFSLLRQFNEIRIAKIFSQYPEYFPYFASCNRNFKVVGERQKKLWCGECPKCAFVFLILAPFLQKDKLIKVFGKNLLNDESLLKLYTDILGFGAMKPFDCVGTFEESRAALYLASKNFKNDLIVKKLLSKVKNGEKYVKEVFKIVAAPTLPARFKLFGLETVGIVGHGTEGKVTEKYIKKNHPDIKIKILDEAIDKNYLDKQKSCDFTIKTPGVSKNKITIPYTTATNLFFSENRNLTIGVTGSKGKSTTASLLHHILKSSGKRVRLLGNIGNPMLEALLDTPPRPNKSLWGTPPQKGGEGNPPLLVEEGAGGGDYIFVIELSSYMLEDVEYSPNIAVLLNLFPEHMNYHGGVKNYYQAKNNIFKFQKPGDIAIRSPFSVKIPVSKSKIPLLGKHNLENIKAAIKVARLFKVSDKTIREAILDFKSLPHRLEAVGDFKGIQFYDDAISTTPESTIAALEALPDTVTILLGGEDRGYNFTQLEKVLRKSKVENIVLFPDTGRRILKSKKGFNILETKSMDEAVRFAFEHIPKGKICLLSTASPSYSLWKNFREKGDSFQSFVKKYGKR